MTKPINEDEKLVALSERYAAAGHRIQTGIALKIGRGDELASAKHLRVGVDLRASDDRGLATLLMEKGIFTRLEYVEAITAAAEQEANDLELELQRTFNQNIKLI